ncbi:hypothetical protein SUGI_0866000 [Cryptomeria japonica]|nr:hypothetical protein SUGI_0866000 [Cryptomeria japonica]
MVMRHLWKERNAKIYKGKETPTTTTQTKIEMGLSKHENMKVGMKKHKYFSTWDHKMQTESMYLQASVNYCNKAKSFLPLHVKLKLNFDDAPTSSPKASGVGFIVRRETRSLVWAGAVKLPNRTNNGAEFNALLQG